ncbi:MAG: phenylalanine--tRNA ligase beta subunit-related protein [Candidatus Eisenbacteria bacterium]
MRTRVTIEVTNPDLVVGLVEARGIAVAESPPGLREKIESLVATRRHEDFPPPERRAAVRKLLRAGGFQASGRNKPASEYLAGRARAGEYPFHSNVVDIGNFISLRSGLPISVLDLERALAGAGALSIRLGAADESYVFNPAGQEIRLRGLICVARPGGPALGNPVKDSMGSKVTPETGSALGVIYASRGNIENAELEDHLFEFARLLRSNASAAETGTGILTA